MKTQCSSRGDNNVYVHTCTHHNIKHLQTIETSEFILPGASFIVEFIHTTLPPKSFSEMAPKLQDTVRILFQNFSDFTMIARNIVIGYAPYHDIHKIQSFFCLMKYVLTTPLSAQPNPTQHSP